MLQTTSKQFDTISFNYAFDNLLSNIRWAPEKQMYENLNIDLSTERAGSWFRLILIVSIIYYLTISVMVIIYNIDTYDNHLK